jgi:hypothetical protein
MTPRRPLRLPLCLLLLGGTFRTVVVVQAQCTLCADGVSMPAANASIGGTKCSVVEAVIVMTPADNEVCTMTQVEGYKYCGCPTFPETVYCSLCQYNGSYVALDKAYQDLVVPGTSITCADAEFRKLSDGDCSTIQTQAAWFCGCPNTTRSSDCHLCTNATATPNNLLLPPTFNKTCAALDREAGTNSQCVNLTSTLPIDVEAYCGCVSNAVPLNSCRVCGDGIDVLNPDSKIGADSAMTCKALDAMAAFVNDANYCTTIQTDYAVTCCMPVQPSQAPVAAPTKAPVAANATSAPAPAPDAASPVAAPTSDKGSNSTSSASSRVSVAAHVAMIALVLALASLLC